MKILSIAVAHDILFGYLEIGMDYVSYEVTDVNKITYGFKYPKSDYKDRSHFINVMGKFDPDCVFIDPVIFIDALEYKQLLLIHAKAYANV
ncbi:MAG: hypothetical protein KAR20_21885 [Candidatus Heimdallarchaeota archaeon]|nr:hypothetical protein [Candidatus Heimdallarchaeota archaeon]